MGSQSLFTSVERQFTLHRIAFLGIAIIATWLLSPLGGQASLRLLSTGSSQNPIDTTVGYYPISSFQNLTVIGAAHLEECSWTRYGPPFLAALQVSPVNGNDFRDIFGNARIPDISFLGADTEVTPLSSD